MKPKMKIMNSVPGYSESLLERAGVKIEPTASSSGGGSRSEQFAGFQTDAPSCDGCGSIVPQLW